MVPIAFFRLDIDDTHGRWTEYGLRMDLSTSSARRAPHKVARKLPNAAQPPKGIRVGASTGRGIWILCPWSVHSSPLAKKMSNGRPESLPRESKKTLGS